jgi:hypothetical protein
MPYPVPLPHWPRAPVSGAFLSGMKNAAGWRRVGMGSQLGGQGGYLLFALPGPIGRACAETRWASWSVGHSFWGVLARSGPSSRLALRIELPLQGQRTLEGDYLPGSEH